MAIDIAIAAVGAAAKVAEGIQKIASVIDSDRSAIIELVNNTDHTLQVDGHDHSSGGFAEPPNHEIPPRTISIFGSKKKSGSAAGAIGWVRYRVVGRTAKLEIHWSNPYVGPANASAKRQGSDIARFKTPWYGGVGNQAKHKFELIQVDMRGHNVYGGILDKWAILKWDDGPMGSPRSSERAAADGTGRTTDFDGGTICWRADNPDDPGQPGLKAFATWGSICARWRATGAETNLGYPITDERGTPDRVGRYNHFRRYYPDGRTADSSIYWTPSTGAHEVYGGIRQYWAKKGWEKSSLGYPIDHEKDDGRGGRVQRFQKGRIAWNSTKGAYELP